MSNRLIKAIVTHCVIISFCLFPIFALFRFFTSQDSHNMYLYQKILSGTIIFLVALFGGFFVLFALVFVTLIFPFALIEALKSFFQSFFQECSKRKKQIYAAEGICQTEKLQSVGPSVIIGEPLPKPKLGEMLIKAELITPEDLEKCIARRNETGEKLGTCIVELGFLSDETIISFLAKELNLPIVNLNEMVLPENLIRRFKEKTLMTHMVIPLSPMKTF